VAGAAGWPVRPEPRPPGCRASRAWVAQSVDRKPAGRGRGGCGAPRRRWGKQKSKRGIIKQQVTKVVDLMDLELNVNVYCTGTYACLLALIIPGGSAERLAFASRNPCGGAPIYREPRREAVQRGILAAPAGKAHARCRSHCAKAKDIGAAIAPAVGPHAPILDAQRHSVVLAEALAWRSAAVSLGAEPRERAGRTCDDAALPDDMSSALQIIHAPRDAGVVLHLAATNTPS